MSLFYFLSNLFFFITKGALGMKNQVFPGRDRQQHMNKVTTNVKEQLKAIKRTSDSINTAAANHQGVLVE